MEDQDLTCSGFKLQHKKIVIYGAGAQGILLKRLLDAEKCRIEGFIDARGDRMPDVEGLIVRSPSRFFQESGPPEAYAVVITVKNVFEHAAIADQFIHQGFRNLVFKPRAVLAGRGTPAQHAVSLAHDALIIERRVPPECISASDNGGGAYFENRAPLVTHSTEVTVRIPIELLETNTVEGYYWSEKNFTAVYPLVELYHALLGKSELCLDICFQRYLYDLAALGAGTLHMETDEGWAGNIRRSRAAVCQEMDRMVDLDPDFFIRNAPSARFDAGKFILTSSGKNRVAFLYAKGYRYIPVRLSMDAYHTWKNEDVCNRVMDYLARAGQPPLFSTIPHPSFYQYPTIFPQFRALVLEKVARLLEREQFHASQGGGCRQAVSVLDLWRDSGISSRYFAALGYRIQRCEPFGGEEEQACVRLLDELLYTKALPYVTRLEASGAYYDVICCSSRSAAEEMDWLCSLQFRRLLYLDWGDGNTHLEKLRSCPGAWSKVSEACVEGLTVSLRMLSRP